MPSQNHSGLHGIPWYRCDRCGYDYPTSKLVRQRGLILCIEKCWDNPQAWERDAIIQEQLVNPEQEMDLAEILKDNQNDDLNPYEAGNT